MPEEKNVDLVVIGGGSGGYAAAKKAVAEGLSVVVVEKAKELGGLCILRGCMPTKALLETSNRMRAIEEAEEFGIEVEKPVLNLDALRERKSRLVSGFQEWRVKGLTKGEFELVKGEASFLDQHRITVAGQVIRAKSFVIATGSYEKVPPIEGLSETPFWTSDEIVEMPSVPARVVVVGTGAVGMESAHLFQGLGSKVTIISRSRPLISSVEPEVSAAMEKRCADLGIDLVFENGLQRVNHDGSEFSLTLADGTVLSSESLVMATGRQPALRGLALENAGFPSDIRRLEIDAYCQTSVPHIFAVGDCASPLAVVHLAVMQGEAAGVNVARQISGNALSETWDEDLKIFGIFTDPEVVQVGFTAEEARERGYEVVTADYPFDDQGKGEIVGEKHGLVMLVADRQSRRLLGASGMGPHVIDYAHTMMVALHQKLTVDEFIKIPSYHPTLGEIWSYVAEEFEF